MNNSSISPPFGQFPKIVGLPKDGGEATTGVFRLGKSVENKVKQKKQMVFISTTTIARCFFVGYQLFLKEKRGKMNNNLTRLFRRVKGRPRARMPSDPCNLEYQQNSNVGHSSHIFFFFNN